MTIIKKNVLGNAKRNFCTTKNMLAKVRVGDISINYEQMGQGTRAALFLPGALGSIKTDFAPQVRYFKDQESIRSVFWDPPGYGKSRPPDRDFSGNFFEKDAKVATALMKISSALKSSLSAQTLGYEKFSVVGWSDGGITALQIALRYPACVDKIVIWGANAYLDENDLELYKKVRDIERWSDRMKKPMLDLYGLEYFKITWLSWIEAMTNLVENNGVLYYRELSSIHCPTLIIHGSLDAMVDENQARVLHDEIRGSTLVTWEAAKHNLHLRYSDEFNKLLQKFLTK